MGAKITMLLLQKIKSGTDDNQIIYTTKDITSQAFLRNIGKINGGQAMK